MDFSASLSIIFLVVSPILFIAGLIVAIASKGDNRKTGLLMVLGAVISFIIGFGICASNFGGGGGFH
jgi:NhaP-type Na+/H+ or K+/H+ antiporter